MHKYSFHSKLDDMARYLTLFSLACIPFSPFLNRFFVAASVLTMVGGKFKEKMQIVCSYLMNIPALLLLLLLTLGLFYNPYGFSFAFHYYIKYVHLFFAIFLIPIFIEKKWRRRAINTLIWAATFSAIIHIIVSFHIFDVYPIKLRGPLPYSTYLAFTAFVILNRMIDEIEYRMLYLACILVLLYVLYYLNIERTGMLVFVCLLVLLGYQRKNWKGLAGMILLTLVAVIGVYFTSTTVYTRVHSAIQEIKTYQIDPTQDSSMAWRLLAIKYSLEHLSQRPWFGYGTGLYSDGHAQAPDPTMQNHLKTTENTYLQIALQIGLVGLIVLLIWIAMQFYESRYLPKQDRILTQGIIVSFVIANFCFPVLQGNLSAIFYFLMIAILFAGKFQKRIEHS